MVQIGDITRTDQSNQLPKAAIGSFSRDTTLASGLQVVTGLGFRASVVFFMGTDQSTHEAWWGFDRAGAPKQVLYDKSGGGAVGNYAASSIYSIYNSQGVGVNEYKGDVQSFDPDGFTIVWVKSETPTGTITVRFCAFK